MRRYELTDPQWALIEDLFPEQTMGRPRLDDRRLFNGILWILCSGDTMPGTSGATYGGAGSTGDDSRTAPRKRARAAPQGTASGI